MHMSCSFLILNHSGLSSEKDSMDNRATDSVPESSKHKPIPVNTIKDFADNISEMIKEKYYSLLSGLEDKLSTRKAYGMAIDEDLELTSQNKLRNVYAGIIQSNVDDPEAYKLICVATGTKCIDGEFLSMEGFAVNDWYKSLSFFIRLY